MRRTLLAGLLSGLLVAVLAASMLIYTNARDEANSLFDSQLQQVAESFPSYALAEAPAAPLDEFVTEGRLVIQVWGRDPIAAAFSSSALAPPRQRVSGFLTVRAADGDWRVFTRMGRYDVVQVAQPMAVRSRQAAGVALRTALPLLALLPLLGGLIWVVVGRGLGPLRRVAAEVSQRSPDALQPIPEHGLPDEVQPVIGSLNDLLGRLSHALEAQRAFVADAAHALRTPVTALQLQAQLLERADGEAERRAAAAALMDGLKRLTRLVEQLLTLAREDPEQTAKPGERVDLTELAREVVAEQSVLAEAKSIDLGFSDGAATAVEADRHGLRVLLGNLVDNAIRYTPGGGRVDVRTGREAGAVFLCVEDSGPGIPPEARARVFDRFFRLEQAGSGSGLGLAIVQNIAHRCGARVDLADGEGGHGLKVTVRFPVDAATAAADA